MQYKPIHFKIWEMVPPELMSLPEDYLCNLFDENLLIVIDRLRMTIGKPITINNWKTGGQYKWSGYRTNSCKIGAKLSAHRIGMAFDIKVSGMSPTEVSEYILSHQAMFPEITEIEDVDSTPSWFHISCRPHNKKGIRIIKP